MNHPLRYLWFALTLMALALAAACGSNAVSETVSGQIPASTPTVPVSSNAQTANVLAAGEFKLPAAESFDEPGFHAVLTSAHDLPAGLAYATGKRLVLKLWDADRPGQNCRSEHPLSGCATVDWSDAEGRPNVPLGGVFENSVTLQVGGEDRVFFLSKSGDLKDSPDTFDPG